MEKVSHMDVKFMWGNSNYDYVFSEAAGNSGGILCIWEESFFKKDYVTISDSFVAIYGTWIPSKTKLLVVSIYAPQQPSLRRVLWEYLLILLGRWNGEAILMGDYNEVRTNVERRGSKNSIVSELRDIDKRLDQYGPIDSLIFRRQDLMSNLNDLKEMEDMDFVQKAKVRWAIEGDENSKYFHGIINKKRSNLAIRGVFVDDQVADLRLHVSHDEFIIGPDFCEAVEHFFKQGSFSKGCNSSFIALIPKVLDAKFVNDYRPISLIGCIYKVVTKILASRLAMVIAGLVSNTQSAFVAGRQILDGPFILNEVLDWCKRKKKKALFFKVDFAKAYDSVRWDFLLDVLEAFGFGSTCVLGLVVFLILLRLRYSLMESPSDAVSYFRVVEDVFKAFVTGVFGLILIYFMQDEPFLWANGLINLLEVPKGVLKVMESIRSNFFKGASMLEKKIFWIAWDKFLERDLDGDIPLCELCPRLFALDSAPNICVAAKMAGPLDTSFRRSVRGGVEQQEFSDLSSFLNSVVLSTSNDRWYFSLSSSGEFSVKDTRLAIDDLVLPSHSEPTRWVKLIPIKINVFMWRARRGCLPTRYNLVQKGVILESTSCPVCFSDEDDVHHLLFRCSLSQEVLHRVCRWWEIDFQLWRSFSKWDAWFSSIRLPGSVKGFLEGVFYVAWWFIWGFRNRSTFDVNKPSRSILFENIVSSSFLWCNSRCSRKFSRDDWLKNPHLISL
ncbi:RNA-directed DNA polymerase, eukaryota [Tanacetum coccineum]